MARTVAKESSLRRAFAISTALHAVVLPLLLMLLAAPALTDFTNFAIERPSAASERITVEHRPAPRAALQPHRERVAFAAKRDDVAQRAVALARQPRSSAAAPRFPTPHHVAEHRVSPRTSERAAPLSASVADLPATSRQAVAPEAKTLAAVPAAQPAAEAASAATIAVATPSATPPPALSTATPAAAPAPSAAPVRDPAARVAVAAPIGGWGDSFEKPMIADDGALADLRKRYHASGLFDVAVDDTGRATHVSIPASVPADVRDAIERELLELRYVPAECNGLRCTGTLEITL